MKSVEQLRTENLAQLIKDRFGERRGAKTAFAKAMGWEQPGLVSRYLAGKRIDKDLARRMERVGGKPAHWLDNDHARNAAPAQMNLLHEVEQREHFYHIPLSRRFVEAGHGVDTVGAVAQGSIAFRKDYMDAQGLDVAKLETWFVTGDSMLKVLRHGDLVLVNTAIKDIINGEMYALYDAREGARIKYVHEQRDGGLVLVSENPAYLPDHVPPAQRGDIEIIGIVELRSGRIRRAP